MWSDTVTIYRKTGTQVERIICNNCRFEVKVESKPNILGDGQALACFLAVPGPVKVKPGDRVAGGIGAEGIVPMEAIELTYANPFYLHGQLHHTEAG